MVFLSDLENKVSFFMIAGSSLLVYEGSYLSVHFVLNCRAVQLCIRSRRHYATVISFKYTTSTYASSKNVLINLGRFYNANLSQGSSVF